MPLGVYTDGPEQVGFKQYSDALLRPDQIRIRTDFAAVKQGTEMTLFSGSSPFSDRRFDPKLRMFMPAEGGGGDGITRRFIGNMVVGEVTGTGSEVTSFELGDRVYGYGPIAETATLSAKSAYLMPADMRPQDIVCLDPSLVALGAVRDAQVTLGDNVVISGLGAIGLIGIQMLKLSGALNLIAFDPIAKRRELACRYGATLTLDPTACDVGLEVHKALGVGADIAIECSGSYRALSTALRCVRQCGRVVTVGYYRGVDSVLELGAEWHHNRLELRSSMPDWGNPCRDHPLWDRDRISSTALEMFRRKLLTSDGIVQPIVPFSEAADAFMAAYRDASTSVKLGVVFESAAQQDSLAAGSKECRT